MHWDVGRVRVTKVVEHDLRVGLNGLLVDVPDDVLERHPWLQPDYVDATGAAVLSIHGFVVETGSRRILVDTCIGGDRAGLPFPPMASGFADALEAAGFTADGIDTVVCTHLHFDHVGGNTRHVDGRWVPTFPQARYVLARAEWEHWSQAGASDPYTNIDDTIRPLLDAGLADLVEADHVVCPQVRLAPAPGHTPGQVCVVIEDAGAKAVITGDLAHHPLQFVEPGIAAPADTDPALAALTRRSWLAERAADGALVLGTHFGGTSAGHVVADGDTWRFVPAPAGG